MSQIVPVDVELAVVIHMYQLVSEGIFHVFLVPKVALT